MGGNSSVQGEKDILVTSRNGGRKITQSIRITSRPSSRKRIGSSWVSSDKHLLK